MELAGIQGLKGTVSVPGDKSISHRCIMFGSIANGTTEIHNFLKGADCLATIRCFQSMGINIEETALFALAKEPFDAQCEKLQSLENQGITDV